MNKVLYYFTREQTAVGGLDLVLSVSSEIQPAASSLCSVVAAEVGPPCTPEQIHNTNITDP